MSVHPKLDIYKGIEPGDLPIYFIPEAAHYLRLPPGTIWSWTIGGKYPTRSGSRVFHPLISIADSAKRMLSFQNLVELHVLGSIRRTHRVELKAVRRAIQYLREQLDSKHPLLEKQMLTDGKSLFIEQYGNLVNISAFGQMEMKRVLELYLRRIQWDDRGIPRRLFPFTRELEQSPQLVAINPRVQFGKPCIAGTGIPTAIIKERHEAGDSVTLLAEDYGRSPEEIEEALRYESRIAS